MSPRILDRAISAWRWRVAEARGFRERLISDPVREYRAWNGDVRWRRLCFAHDDLGWRFVPNQRARVFHAGRYHVVRTNGHGFRSDNEFHEQRARRRRLIVLGDSYAAGDGVNNAERFSDLLEDLLEDTEVLNFAMPGTGMDQQVLIFERAARKMDADACLFCPADMDIFRLAVRAWPALEWGSGDIRYRAKPYFTMDGGELRLNQVPVPRGMRVRSAMNDWGEVDFLRAKAFAEWQAAYAPGSGLRAIMDALAVRFLAAAGGMPVFFIPLPSPAFGSGDWQPVYMDAFRSLADADRKSVFVDVLPVFRSLETGARRNCYLADDPHYSAEGHAFVAKAIADGVGPYLGKPGWTRSL
ncbi:MAG: SGNH/GDSL hydrolase family protein [Lentisphaerae bacterium]|nr:SGNH/GDSL hydrolase family protein [Lentisphaerota bacterium]